MNSTCLEIARAASLGDGVKRGAEIAFKCPRHDDQKPSLEINPAKNGWHCEPCDKRGNAWSLAAFIAGVSPDEKAAVAAWLQDHNLLDGHKAQGKIVATYSYHDRDGNELYETVRFEPKDFRQRRKGQDGDYIWNVQGLKRLIYNLPNVLEAEYIFVTEGERDVESLREIGLTATCNTGGAGKWTAELAQYFNDHQHVTIIPDNDEPGRKHVQQVAASLHGKVASLKILELAGLPDKGDVSDWLIGRDLVEAAEELCKLSEGAPKWKPAASPPARPNGFEAVGEDRYRLAIAEIGVTFEVDRLRREHHELIGELAVRCELPAARTCLGTLSVADFNISSARARSERAKLLAVRSQAESLDWSGYVEEFCQRVLAAERSGAPAVDLRTLPLPSEDDELAVGNFRFPRRHPTILFGDGGSGKSYLALYLAGRLAERGLGVALFDWELCGEDHRLRLKRLFGLAEPAIMYARCERPLVHEVDRLRRIVQDHHIDYAVFDSVAFACDGPPEAAEVASRYFQATRRILPASLHVAHVKAEKGDQRPFGSIFWSNMARSSWFAKLAHESADGKSLVVGLFHRKVNLGRLHKPAGFEIKFEGERTFFTSTEPADIPDLAEKMSIRQRMVHLLRAGEMSVEKLADDIEADIETVRRTARRHKGLFTLLEGGKVALLQRVS